MLVMGSAMYSANAPGPIDSHSLGVRAKMTPARQAIPAPAAGHVPFPAHDVAGIKVGDVRTHFHNFAHKLVPDHHRHMDGFLRPVVPLINVQIRAADARAMHANEHVINANFRLLDVLKPKSRFSFTFYECFHFANPPAASICKGGRRI